MDATLLVDHQSVVIPGGPDGVIVRALLTINGSAPAGFDRAPVALSFVLDRSGSMQGERLDSARSATARAVERLHPADIVSAVAFDDMVDVIAPPAPRQQHRGLIERLSLITAGGSTNLSGGWLRGRQHMEQALALLDGATSPSHRVVLLTDGHANHGITDPVALVELARQARLAGITTTTIGVGEGYDDDLLRAMADAGGGNAWYVERPDQAHDVMAEELGNLLSVCAQGLQVTLEMSESVDLFAVHTTWPLTRIAGNAVRLDLGDLYASEPKPVLIELFVPRAIAAAEPDAGANANTNANANDNASDANAASPRVIATMRIEADVLLDSGSVEHRVIALPVADSLDAQRTMVPEIERAVVLARAAKAREDAVRRQREGDAEGAATLMQDTHALIASSPLMSDVRYAAELEEHSRDLEAMREQYASHQFSELEAKYQMQRAYNTRRGKRRYDEVLSRRPEQS